MDEEFSFRDIVELAQDVIIVTRAEPLDPPGPVIVYVNPAFTRLTGYSRQEAIGQNPRILQGVDTDRETTHTIRAKLEKGEPLHVAIENYTKDGRSYWLDLSIMPLRNAARKLTHFVAIERDVSLQKELERKLTELATLDPLTGLFNRREFFDQLDSFWDRFRRSGEPFALIDIDIDWFKTVNDTYGHDHGDKVLQAIATMIRSQCRPNDLIARVGGEEFSVLVEKSTKVDAFEIAERIRKHVEIHPVQLPSGPLAMTVSLGVALVDPGDSGPSQFLKRADDALYDSKRQGRNRTTFLDFEAT